MSTPTAYICFDGDNDFKCYQMMRAWSGHDHIDFDFLNAHDLRPMTRATDEAYIKRVLRQRLEQSDVLIVLIGESTRNLYRFVRWELEIALAMGLPIIAVNLNQGRNIDGMRCPPVIRDKLAIHVAFRAKIIQYALKTWPAWHRRHLAAGTIEPRYYIDSVYSDVGL